MKNVKYVKEIVDYLNSNYPAPDLILHDFKFHGVHHKQYRQEQSPYFSAFFHKEDFLGIPAGTWEIVFTDYKFNTMKAFLKEKAELLGIARGLGFNLMIAYQYIVTVEQMKTKFKPFIIGKK